VNMQTRFYDRFKGSMKSEKVYGDKLVKWLYGTSQGRYLSIILSKALFSRLYGYYQNTRLSRKKIDAFIKEFNIEMVSSEQTFPVKGEDLSSTTILDSEVWEGHFAGGPILIARLCPVDYHRFHFPDHGEVVDQYEVSGSYHSVNPIALAFKSNILSTNQRRVTILNTKNFGKLAYVEVGAMCVGRIVHTHSGRSFNRGDEKGYFLFGGSTVIVLGEKGKWRPYSDILEYSQKGIETFVRLGSSVAVAG